MMKRSKSMEAFVVRKWRLSHILFVVAVVYLLIVGFKFYRILEIVGLINDDRNFTAIGRPAEGGDVAELSRPLFVSTYSGSLYRHLDDEKPPPKPGGEPIVLPAHRKTVFSFDRYGRITGAIMKRRRRQWGGNLTELERTAHEASALGMKAWEEVKNYVDKGELNPAALLEGKPEPCPLSVSLGKNEAGAQESLMFLPCGLEVGSSITIIGTPRSAHEEYVPQLAKLKQGKGVVMISQFSVELQGLKAVDGEEPPKILHFNPRLKGDWSGRPVIEHNTCYRMQWGKSMRCDGIASKDEDDTVDGLIKCEKWLRSDVDPKESKTTSWLKRFIGRAKKPEMTWSYPFVEGRLFVLTICALVEGYHVYVGGRHITSFQYRPGFTIEDATGLAVKGNVDVHSIFASSLPNSHPSFSRQQVLELSESWKSDPLPKHPIELFIGILSATNHFAERMAIRRTWMQYSAIKLLNVVVRFFVALSPRKEVNVVLKREADYFGDIIILPFMDRYELVVLKTVAICEFGVNNLTAAYIMKCDDDTFVRLDVVLREMNNAAGQKSLYMGNLNLLHRPLRNGKWAVTYEEWPEEVYPPYANGPGYVISSDIAKFIVSKHANHTLSMFKMEDVSMGMWVEEFNASTPVQYAHNWKFCQYGCMDEYYTSHYQSPRQMICLWDKLARGRAQCCNFR